MPEKSVRYFRNKAEIKRVEPDALWKLRGEALLLVDDDQYEAVMLEDHEDKFYEVTDLIAPAHQPIG